MIYTVEQLKQNRGWDPRIEETVSSIHCYRRAAIALHSETHGFRYCLPTCCSDTEYVSEELEEWVKDKCVEKPDGSFYTLVDGPEVPPNITVYKFRYPQRSLHISQGKY